MSLLSRVRSLRRSWLVNGFLALALALVGVVTFRAVAVGSSDAVSTAQTATVDTGTVTSTVTSSGNIAAARTVGVNFEGSGGVVRAIYVKPGQVVHKGQALARVDGTSARQALHSAQVQLASAEASYEQTTEGETSQERASDQQQVAGAQVSLNGAMLSLRSARQSYTLDRRQQNEAVEQASSDLSRAEAALSNAQSAHHANPSTDTEEAVEAARTAVSTARSALSGARNQRASALLADRQQVQSQVHGVAAAEQQLAAAKAGVAVSQEPPRASAVASAQAQVDGARIDVQTARKTVAETTLRAPVAGKVAAVDGAVGEQSSGGSSSSDSSSSTSSSSSSSSSSTSTSGFVTLVSAGTLEVTADVAEADINDVKVGQPVALTLAANDRRLTGTVSAVDTTSTVTNDVVEYGVTVRVKAVKHVRIGQTAQLIITTGSKSDALRVSSSALTTIGKVTTATVRAADGRTSAQVVQTGLVGDTYTQIVSGLSAGDVVVLPQQTITGSTGFTFPGGGTRGLGGLK
jgi:HlyD family secretion protein